MNNGYRFFSNKECEFFPCHPGMEEFNCLFCYCPLYSMESCPGKPRFMEKDDKRVKICTDCTFPHQPQNYEAIIDWLRKC